MPKIAVIYGSSRHNGTGDRVVNHFKKVASTIKDAEIKFLTVRDYDLPFFDDDVPLMVPDRQLTGNAQKWVEDVKDADGYLIITPEYNRSIPGVLKNGIDYLGYEIKGKPVKIVSYSINMAGGAKAATALVDMLHMLNAVALPTNTALSKAQEWLNEDGSFNRDADGYKYNIETAQNAVQEIIYYANALKDSPYQK